MKARLLKQMKLNQFRIKAVVNIIFVLLTAIACSQQGAYTALQKQHEIRCNRVPESDYEACMEEAKKQYDDYKQQRDEIVKQ